MSNRILAIDQKNAVVGTARPLAAGLSLKTATASKGDHSKARTAIDLASRHLVGLVNDLNGTLDQLEVKIAGTEVT